MTAEEAKDALRSMMLIRAFEEALAKKPDHGFQLLSTGEEAVAVGICSALSLNDQLLTGGRSIGPALARGCDPRRVMAELLGKSSGTNRGKGGRGHLADPTVGFFGSHAVVAGNISIAAGVALSMQMSRTKSIVTILFGDGAFGAGALHEVLNIAATWKLPLLFVCNNNQLSVSTPRATALAPKNLSDIGLAFGIPSKTVDGMDVNTVAGATGEAVDWVRSGRGPAFLECMSLRFASHSTTARETRSKAELAEVRTHCPILKQAAALRTAGIVDDMIEAQLNSDVADIIGEAIAFADASEYPDPAEALTDVW
jgi:TPP-dependent pyruvate/acetoin dehydrogenase alpha subunit